MKLRSHYIFSTGLLTLFNSLIISDFYINVIISGIISVISNSIIDNLGHEIRGPYIARTPRTHTIPRSILWGVIPSIILIVIFELVASLLFGSDYAFQLYFVTIFLDGIIVGPSHMLLDVFTEKGIYIKKNNRWTRFALAHFKYNNPIVNGLAILIGMFMLYFASILNGF
ncbi:DUF1286 domain-containing protein [Acidianus sulfidivorans JP7]|uniref:Conjugal transfer protein n=1 Tax=Acidianus sulfidivorans JP7 TaxID=619593 RepID=A0A2U9ILU3_9CREN|nr:DUF1286 domain-containing protein [Acidianus sulfidivorans]AWR96983.1 DUF1286 domain-containing protein [Acidianus sulfidivorans JP7]